MPALSPATVMHLRTYTRMLTNSTDVAQAHVSSMPEGSRNAEQLRRRIVDNQTTITEFSQLIDENEAAPAELNEVGEDDAAHERRVTIFADLMFDESGGVL